MGKRGHMGTRTANSRGHGHADSRGKGEEKAAHVLHRGMIEEEQPEAGKNTGEIYAENTE